MLTEFTFLTEVAVAISLGLGLAALSLSSQSEALQHSVVLVPVKPHRKP